MKNSITLILFYRIFLFLIKLNFTKTLSNFLKIDYKYFLFKRNFIFIKFVLKKILLNFLISINLNH